MAGRGKEVAVVLLDVGPTMHNHLELAARAVTGFLTSKMLSKPAHETSLVFFGTTGTANSLHAEMAQHGDVHQYMHITMQHELEPPTLDHLRSLKEVPRGSGSSDFVDALTVALDWLYRAMTSRATLSGAVAKRVLLVSNFLTMAQDDPEDNFIPVLIERMQEGGVALEVVSLDIPGEDEGNLEAKNFNSNILARICSEVTHTLTSVSHPADLAGVFKARQYGHVAYYSGNLMVGEGMAIKVKVCKKTSQEKFPSLGQTSPLQDQAVPAGGVTYPESDQGVSLAKQYVKVADPEEFVANAGVIKAWRYGRELVPLNVEEEDLLKYSPDKGIWLVGFVDRDRIPRHHYMKDCWCLVADKGDVEKSGVALGALVRALHKQQKLAIVRFVPRRAGAVSLCVCTPYPATASHPDWLLLNQLPFLEDVRGFTFPAMVKQDRQPRPDQLEAARKLVATMSLGKGAAEEVQLDRTVNPSLHSFYHAMAERALDPHFQVDVQDPLVERVLQPRFAGVEGAQLALAAVKQALPTLPGRGAGRAAAAEEFKDLLGRGNFSRAADFARVRIIELSSSGRHEALEEGADVLMTFRNASVAEGRWDPFNSFFHNISSSSQDPTRRPFWRRVLELGLHPIDSSEVAGSNLTPSQAEAAFQGLGTLEAGGPGSTPLSAT